MSDALDVLKEMSPSMDIAVFEQLKSLITANTLKAMQLLGFDYKAAIGDPLTRACASEIEGKLKVNAVKGQHNKR